METQHDRPAGAGARAWRAGLPEHCRRRSGWVGGGLFGLSAGVYLGLVAGTFLAPWPLVQLACLLLTPVAIGALFVIGHDAAHNSLTHSGLANRVLARLAFLPAWHPYTSWAHAHNTLHHGWTNLKGRHPDFAPLSPLEYRALPGWRRLLERFYRSAPGVGFAYALDFYRRYILFPAPDRAPAARVAFRLDRLLVVCFLAGQLLAAWWLSALNPAPLVPAPVQALLAVFVPWCLWIWFMGVVSFIQHTHPRLAWYDSPEEWSFYHVQLKSTAHVVFPWPLGALLHNIMDHPAHHLDPTIPLYHLPECQRRLEAECPADAVVVPYWTPLEFFRTCRACKLYDFRRHCWTDFAGNPTSAEGLPGLGRRQAG